MSTVLHSILDRSGFSPVTRESYANIIERWIAFAGTNPSGWTRVRAQEFYDWLLDSGIKVKTANHYIASLRYVSKWYSVREGRPEADFAIVQIRADERSNKTRFALTQAEVTQLLEACVSTAPTPLDLRDLTMFVVGLETGMRRKSLAGLDFAKLIEEPRYSYPVARVPIKGAGGIVEYNVPLSDLAVHTIEAWRTWLNDHRYKGTAVLTRLHKRIGRQGFIEWVPDIKGVSKPMINKIVGTRAQAAAIGHTHPHLLRHTFISSRESANLTQVQIAAITGHSLASRSEAGQPRWGEMAGYIDLAAAGKDARNTTPAWLTDLVHELLPRFKGLP